MKSFKEYMLENASGDAGGFPSGGEASFGLNNPPGVKTSDIKGYTPPLDMKKRKEPNNIFDEEEDE